MNKHYRKLETGSTALTTTNTSPSSTELALPIDLLESAKGFQTNSRAKRTKVEYKKWWTDFATWCEVHERDALPANVSTVIGYLTYLATGRNGARRPLAPNSIGVALAAIKLAQRTGGHPFDGADPRLTEVMKGIRRKSAETRAVRRVKPFMFQSKSGISLSDLLEMLRPDVIREARDAALIALGCSGALRRSEVVGLDWAALGTGKDDNRKGFLTIDEGGMTIRLMTSKASQDTAQDVAVPRDFAQLSCKAVENWISVGKIEKGTPLFRGVKGPNLIDCPQSKYRGVTWSREQKKWRAQLFTKATGNRTLGFFETDLAAHKAYCAAKDVPTGRPEEMVKPSWQRLHANSVALALKKRAKQLAEARNKRGKKLTKEELDELVKDIAGHSMRVGFVTSAAERDVPSHRIRQQTRHKTESMVTVYIRDVDIRKNNALKDFGL